MKFGKINYHTQWLVEDIGEDGEHLEEDLVHKDDDLTCAQVAETSEINEFVIYTRRSRLLEVTRASMIQQVMVGDVEKEDEDEVFEEYFDNI